MIVDLSKRWMERGTMACRGKDPEMFFTDHGFGTLARPSDKVQREWDKIKAICAACPVMMECARDNLGEVEGIWGGLDPTQRAHMRHQRALWIRKLPDALKEEYASLAWRLRMERGAPVNEVARIMGVGVNTVAYLLNWWKLHQPAQSPAPEVVDLELPEETSKVEVSPNMEFPERPPTRGDGWVRYDRRVTWGHYLGETEDGAWVYLKIRAAWDHTARWIKAEDFKPMRTITRNVMIRSGRPRSKVYGTSSPAGDRTAAQAG